MKLKIIEAFDIPDSWYRCVKACLKEGYEYTIQRGSFSGDKRRELDNSVITISNPSFKPLVPDVPEGVPPPTSMDYVNRYVEYLVSNSKTDYEDYTYGERISQIVKIEGSRVSSQLDYAIEMLKESPMTNQCCIQVAKPEDITLSSPPCLRLIDCRVRYGKLHFFTYFRSWDAWAGYPSNMAALQLLKEFMSKKIGLEDGTLNAWSKGLHLYSYQWEWARMI